MNHIEREDAILGLNCEETQWKGRDAVRITNGILELIAMLDGGHLACFRFIESIDAPSHNVLWEAPWTLRELNEDWTDETSLQYGRPETGKFVAGFTGHAVCLDYFGDPDPEKAASGLGLHGEAATRRWQVVGCETSKGLLCKLAVALPVSHLRFERGIQVQEQQSVVYVEETLYNELDRELLCDWVQHVTFGPPFLSGDAGTLLASAAAGATSCLGYDGKSLLPAGQTFTWPFVQLESGSGSADLRRPFTGAGKGFLVGTMFDPSRELQYLLAINWALRLGVGYCFRRESYPWMAVWEENCARKDAPWKGSTRARGMEFGTVPLPRTAGERFPYESFIQASTGFMIPGGGTRNARYIMSLFHVPEEVRSIEDVVLSGDTLKFAANGRADTFSIPAMECEAFLTKPSAGHSLPR